MNKTREASGQPQILLATKNAGKLREILDILGDLPVEFRTLSEFEGLPGPIESGRTFRENAWLKASYYAEHTGLVTLAEDSGLEIDALGGKPGVLSARYAGVHGNDVANNLKVLELLKDVPGSQRTARFRCVCVLAAPGRRIAETEGTIEGRILEQLRGTGGFGYDPLFLVPQLGKTTAELSRRQKNRVSHRGKALRAMKGRISQWLDRTVDPARQNTNEDGSDVDG